MESTFSECVILHISDINLLLTSHSNVPKSHKINDKFVEFFITPMPIYSQFREWKRNGLYPKDIVWTGYKSKSFTPPDSSLVYCKGLIDQSTRGWLLSGITVTITNDHHDNLLFMKETSRDKYGRLRFDTLSRKQAFTNPFNEYQYMESVLGTSPVFWLSSMVPWMERPCPGQFSCNDGRCINEEFLCDTVKHCPEGEDELAKKCYKDHQCDNANFWNNHGDQTEINLHLENVKDREITNCYWVLQPPKNTGKPIIENGVPTGAGNYDYGFAVWEMFSFYAPGYELAISYYNDYGEMVWRTYEKGIDIHISNYRNRPLAVRIVKKQIIRPEIPTDGSMNPEEQPEPLTANVFNNHIHLNAKLYWSRQKTCEQIGGYLCKNKKQCISKQFLCNNVVDCVGDADDEKDCEIECNKNVYRSSFLSLPGILRHIPTLHKTKQKDRAELADQLEAEAIYMEQERNNKCSFMLHAPKDHYVELNIFKGFATTKMDDFTCQQIDMSTTKALGSGLTLNLIKSTGRDLLVKIDIREAFQANYKFVHNSQKAG